MKRFTVLLSLIMLFSSSNFAQDGNAPEIIDLDFQPTIIQNGNLNSGFIMPLQWAANSSVACFPATRFVEFQGNHLLYRVQLPAGANVKITVTPKNKKHRINLYALRLGAHNYDSPPDITRAISCEASYPIYVGKPNYRVPAKAQSVEYMSVRKPYNILIGVAGAKGIMEGDFELKLEFTQR